jgi:hypothetical protein
MTNVTASDGWHAPERPAAATAQVARLTVTGSGADRERDALAVWLRGNPVLGRGWRVSAVSAAPDAGRMGGGDVNLLEIVLTGGLSAAQLAFAVLTWRQQRATAGRHGINVCLDCGGTRIEIKDVPHAPDAEPQPRDDR